MSKHAITDFTITHWTHLLHAVRLIDPDKPFLPEQGVCGNVVQAVQIQYLYAEKDKPFPNLMMELLFKRAGLNPDNPLEREDLTIGKWEGPNLALRKSLLQVLEHEITEVLSEFARNMPAPAAPSAVVAA